MPCPHCGAGKETRALAGMRLKCSACGGSFRCPDADEVGGGAGAPSAGDSTAETASPPRPAAEPAPVSAESPTGGTGELVETTASGVRVVRAKGRIPKPKNTRPATPAAPDAPVTPPPPEGQERAKKAGAHGGRSTARSWQRRMGRG